MGIKCVNDKFYTKIQVSKECLDFLGDLSSYEKVVECSAGNGSFSKQINHTNLEAYDILPEDNSIIKQDWFDYSCDLSKSIVISNPPFGIRNKLSKDFIKHCIELNCKTIAMILPNVYNKHTLQSVFPKEYRLVKKKELPQNSFIFNGEDYHVPCTFYVWDRSEGCDLRFDITKYYTEDFMIVSKNEIDTDCFFILGASPNTVKDIKDVNKNNRGYYIKPVKKTRDYLVGVFQNLKFEGMSSVNGGVSWLTKIEIIKNYVERID